MAQSSCRDDLQAARRMIRSEQPVSKTRAERLLRTLVLNEPQGSRCRESAQALLDDLVRLKAAEEPPPNPETVRMQDQWALIYSLDDTRLISAVEALFSANVCENQAIVRLRTDAIEKVARWIGNKITALPIPFKPEEAHYMMTIIRLIRVHPAHGQALIQVERQLNEKSAEQKFESVEKKVAQVLTSWDVQKAHDAREELTSIADQIPDRMKELDNRISEVGRKRERWGEIVSKLRSGPFDDWQQIQTKAIYYQSLQDFCVGSTFDLPSSLQQERDQLTKQFKTLVSAFLRKKAKACKIVEEMTCFYKKFKSLKLDAACFLETSWFDTVKLNYHTELNQKVKVANSANELESLRQKVVASTDGSTAEWFSGELSNLEKDLSLFIRQWDTLATGAESVSSPGPLSLTPPPALVEAQKRYFATWTVLEKWSQRMERSNSVTPTEYQEALEELERILADNDKHLFALTLRDRALEGQLCTQLDAAFERWDIERFIDLCNRPVAHPPQLLLSYQVLADYREPLIGLSKLTHQSECCTVESGLSWLEQWDALLCQEVKKRGAPPSLEGLDRPLFVVEQIRLCFEKRRNSLFQLMNTMLQNPELEAETLHQTTKMLGPWAGEDGFQPFIDKFQQQISLRIYKGQIKLKGWSESEKALVAYRDANGDLAKYDRLKIELKIRRAQAGTPTEMVKVLSDHWYDVVLHFGKDETEAFLLRCIDQSWRDYDAEQIVRIIEMADLIPAQERSPALSKWTRWLELDRLLEQETIDRSTLLELVNMVFTEAGTKIDETLREPLQRRVEQWCKSTGMALYYVWFYHAARQVRPPLSIIGGASDPLDPLAAETDEMVEREMSGLKRLTELKREPLTSALQRLREELSRWERLQGYFNLLTFSPAKQPQEPQSLCRTIDLIERMLTLESLFERLLDADLRAPSEATELGQAIGRVEEVPTDFAMHDALKKRLERLEPLTRLNFFLKQFNRDVERLGKAKDLDTNEIFLIIYHTLKKIISVFETASMNSRGMWKAVSRDCANDARDRGKVHLPSPAPSDLATLSDFFMALHKSDEVVLRSCLVGMERELAKLRHTLPAGQNPLEIDPRKPQYAPFFDALPRSAPKSLRGYQLFAREIKKHPAELLLQAKAGQQADDLPQWIDDYLLNGAPFPCSSVC